MKILQKLVFFENLTDVVIRHRKSFEVLLFVQKINQEQENRKY